MHIRMHLSRDGHAGLPARPWSAYALLLALMLLNHMDRQLVVALFPYLAGQWGLSDAQLASLTSVVPTLVALCTVPMALLGDRWGRVRTVAMMAAVWSLASVLAMGAGSYGQLLGARMLLGLGEAGFSALGAALIAGWFAPALHGALLGGFLALAPLGAAAGLSLGASLAALLGWRLPFGVFGLPGLLLAWLFWRLPEAHRGADRARHEAAAGGMHRALLALLASPGVLLLCLGSALQFLVLSSWWAWLPTLLTRHAGLKPDAAAQSGALFVLAGAAGCVLWGLLLGRGGPLRPRLLGLGLLCLLSWLLSEHALAVLAQERRMPAWILGCAGLLVTCTVGPAAAMLLQRVSEAWRGTGAALLSIAQNLMGLAAGPMLAGWLSPRLGLTGALQGLSHAALLAAAAFVLAGLLCRQGSRDEGPLGEGPA